MECNLITADHSEICIGVCEFDQEIAKVVHKFGHFHESVVKT